MQNKEHKQQQVGNKSYQIKKYQKRDYKWHTFLTLIKYLIFKQKIHNKEQLHIAEEFQTASKSLKSNFFEADSSAMKNMNYSHRLM